MPSWLFADRDGFYRATRLTADKKTLAWMKQFEEGLGFRVRLKPNIKAHFYNTFSRIRHEQSNSFLVKSNSLGFRSDELSRQKSPETIRVVIYGDSSSFGWGVDQENSYSYLLKHGLETEFPEKTFEVGNFAIPGDSSEYGKLIFDAFSDKFPANIIIIGFGANDAKSCHTPHRQQADSFKRQKTLHHLRYWLTKSELFRTLSSVLSLKTRNNDEKHQINKKTAAVRRSDFSKNLRYMGKKAERLGASKVILLGACSPGNYLKRMKVLAERQSYLYFNAQKYLKQVIPDIIADKVHPELVNEMKENYPRALSKNKLFYISSDGCHPNKLGHLLIAEELTRLISEVILEEKL